LVARLPEQAEGGQGIEKNGCRSWISLQFAGQGRSRGRPAGKSRKYVQLRGGDKHASRLEPSYLLQKLLCHPYLGHLQISLKNATEA
jgi:hypothetical protein